MVNNKQFFKQTDIAILFLFGIYSIYLTVFTLSPFEFSLDYFTEFIGFQTITIIKMLFSVKPFDIVSNILLFIPVGIFLCLVIKPWEKDSRYNFKIPLFSGLFISLIIEFVQLFTGRTTSVIDLVTNTAGTILGFYLIKNHFIRSGMKIGFNMFRDKKSFVLTSIFIYSSSLFVLFIMPFRLNSTKNWNSEYSLLLGNETTSDRPWEGQVYITAVYDRALNSKEIKNLNNLTENGEASNIRKKMGCVALYKFSAGEDSIIQDLSGFKKPLDIKGDDLSWSEGGVDLTNESTIRSVEPANKISDAIIQTAQFTVEVWIRTKNLEQTGPARIVTISDGTDQRNFTLAQNQQDIHFRVRTPITGPNGSRKNLIVKSAFHDHSLHHMVATFHHGVEKLFVDGSQVGLLRGDIDYLTILLNMGNHLVGKILLLFSLFFPLGLLVYFLFDHMRFILILLFLTGFIAVVQSYFYLLCAQPFDRLIFIMVFVASCMALLAGWSVERLKDEMDSFLI